MKGRNEEALATLARLHARGNMNDALVQGEYHDMKTQTEMEASLDQSWSLVSVLFPPFRVEMLTRFRGV
jgi:hypothetical protein